MSSPIEVNQDVIENADSDANQYPENIKTAQPEGVSIETGLRSDEADDNSDDDVMLADDLLDGETER